MEILKPSPVVSDYENRGIFFSFDFWYFPNFLQVHLLLWELGNYYYPIPFILKNPSSKSYLKSVHIISHVQIQNIEKKMNGKFLIM